MGSSIFCSMFSVLSKFWKKITPVTFKTLFCWSVHNNQNIVKQNSMMTNTRRFICEEESKGEVLTHHLSTIGYKEMNKS